MNCVRALRTSLSAPQLCVNHYMQSAKALLICMDASSEVTVHAQANGTDEGDNNSDGIRPSGAIAGNLKTCSIEGQESQMTQIKRRKKTETPPTSKSLESWLTNLEQTPLNRSQQLPAPYKRLIDELKQN